ncbi:hypothetical protein [Tenacibaculum finnmarkense]|uniref:hypothetical protein n=1 Tax=Tenacibaculum finnmarkense TaxID=2781243 RepID=UPI002300F940|nr:hypothetical protein [Tenacibaculum finnmarkense]WCC46236.1 hypothetical protein PJH08_07455 [Tenacibaculum finnmarkense]
MELKIDCPICRFYQIQTGKQRFVDGSLIAINNKQTHIFDCSIGGKGKYHSSIQCISNQKFELLFESGFRAYKDGYYREAISSFSTSIERFYEYSIKVLLQGNDNKQANDIWKEISRQSERQLGAFITLFFDKTKNKPNLLGQKMVELRNKVVHKGYYPTKDEALDFCKKTVEIINSNMHEIKKSYNTELMDFNKSYLDNLRNEAILELKNHSFYIKGFVVEKEFEFTKILRPFIKKIPSFLSNVYNKDINVKDIESYTVDKFAFKE